MREIEVKAKVEDFQMVINKLNEFGCKLSEPITQRDKVFLEEGEDLLDVRPTRNVFRIREQEGKFLLTLKRVQSNELDCIECESLVSDVKQIEKILHFLNYKEAIAITKIRRKCKFNDCEICLDEVENLGNFIEIEKISDRNAEEVQEELFQILLKLGIRRENRVLKGYDRLIHQNK